MVTVRLVEGAVGMDKVGTVQAIHEFTGMRLKDAKSVQVALLNREQPTVTVADDRLSDFQESLSRLGVTSRVLDG